MFPQDTEDPYRLNSDGVTYTFVGKQFNLWNFFAHGILPYKKSTITENWVLVGHGVPYSTCGDIIGKKCDNVSEHKEGRIFHRYLRNSCHRRECPICYESWGSIEAERSLIRLASYVNGVLNVHEYIQRIISKHKLEASSDVHLAIVNNLEKIVTRAIHVIISPPPNTVLDKKNYPKFRSKAVKLLRKAGLHGGNLTFHAKRYHCAKCNASIPDYHYACPKCGCKDLVWVDSPHWHSVGFGWIHNTKEIYDKNGWIIKNLGVRESVFATMQYILSHATYYRDPDPSSNHRSKPMNFHITTWFGDLAYNQLASIPKLGLIRDLCPYCGRLLKIMDDNELKKFPPPLEFDSHLDIFIRPC
jgi:DNA-directed RNA polymerase subunit RPC12/RpoP